MVADIKENKETDNMTIKELRLFLDKYMDTRTLTDIDILRIIEKEHLQKGSYLRIMQGPMKTFRPNY